MSCRQFLFLNCLRFHFAVAVYSTAYVVANAYILLIVLISLFVCVVQWYTGTGAGTVYIHTDTYGVCCMIAVAR